MEANALECGICNELYDEGKFCPRILPCSHSYCSSCIAHLISSSQKLCPTCRQKFTAVSASDLMINRSLIDVVRQFGGSSTTFKGFQKERNSQAEREESQTDLFKIRLAQCKEKRTDIQNLIHSSLMFMSDTSNLSKETDSLFNKILQDSKKEAVIMMKRLPDIVGLIQAMEKLVLQEEDKIKALIEKNNIKKSFASLAFKHSEHDDNSIIEFMQNVDDRCVKREEELRLLKQIYFRLESRMAIIQGIMAEEGRDGDCITSENLRKMSNSLREIIEAGKLLAFQDHQGRRRYASVKLESKKSISLFQLKELKHVPKDSFLIKIK